MYRSAYSHDGKTVFYLDSFGHKYAVSGGNLSWRLNNPGLMVRHSGRYRFGQDAIGHFDRYSESSHAFATGCYQRALQKIIQKYRKAHVKQP